MVSYMTCNSDLKRRGIFKADCWDLQRVALGWLAAVRDLVDHVYMALIGRFDQECHLQLFVARCVCIPITHVTSGWSCLILLDWLMIWSVMWSALGAFFGSGGVAVMAPWAPLCGPCCNL